MVINIDVILDAVWVACHHFGFISIYLHAILSGGCIQAVGTTPTYVYIYNTNSVCVCVCLSSIGGKTAGPIMTKFGTHMRIDLGMVPTKYWPHEWPGSVGSLGPISESGLS